MSFRMLSILRTDLKEKYQRPKKVVRAVEKPALIQSPIFEVEEWILIYEE